MRNVISSHFSRGRDRMNIVNALLWAGLILLLSFVLKGSPNAEEVILITVAAAGTSLTLNRAKSGDGDLD